ncbi:MAG: ATP-binding protein [Pyrinomonadaceae bacterium]
MKPVSKILSLAANFIGRDAELDRLLRHAQGGPGGITVLAAPGAGASELLLQTFDRLFVDNLGVIPFYFELSNRDVNTKAAARRFAHEFLTHAMAYRRQDPGIIASAPGLYELAELSPAEDARWVDRFIAAINIADGDRQASIRHSLSLPLRAAAAGVRALVMIDNLSAAADMVDGEHFVAELRAVFAHGNMPFVVAGYRRDVFKTMPFDPMHLENLTTGDAGRLVDTLAASSGVPVNDETRDLIAVQIGGNAAHIAALITSAGAKGISLDNFERVEQAYGDEIFGGRISRNFDSVLDRIEADAIAQAKIVKIIGVAAAANGGAISREYFVEAAGIDQLSLNRLHVHEFVNVDADTVTFDADNIPLSDYIAGRDRTTQGSRALAVGNATARYIKRAPSLMARTYRRSTAIGLRELMMCFDGQLVPEAVLDYRVFREEFKGASDHAILDAANGSGEILLPRIVFAAHANAFYPHLAEMCDPERSAIALGFASDDTDVAWIAAEIESKLEVGAELAGFWCDRLEMTALNCNFANYKIWLIAPEGFDDAAADELASRGAIGSSRRQASLLAGLVGSGSTAAAEAEQYELTLPMSNSTELIAARAVEDVARRHGFDQKAVNQIKTAVVEAFINAAEHSMSPDGRISQKFAFADNRLTITLRNRGIRLLDKRGAVSEETRRGWGLKLIENLMDEVTVGQTDDGTEISMVKILDTPQKARTSNSG